MSASTCVFVRRFAPARAIARGATITLVHVPSAFVRSASALTLVLSLASASAAAQQPMMSHDPVPQVVVTGRGEVKVAPDRALLSLTVETRRPQAAAASQENARLQRLVFDTLRAAGIAAADLSTTDYSVQPEQRWNQQKQQAELIGYIVRNTIRVRILNIEQTGKVIDAALSKGSNLVSSLELYASNVEAARRQALAQAVEQARADAEVMAKAAGGTIAGLIELSTAESDPSPMPQMQVMSMRGKEADSPATPIAGGTQSLVTRVHTRWRFSPSK